MTVAERLPKLVPPRVQAAVLRIWFKGLVNSWLHHTKGFVSRCPWGCCGPDKDTLEHVLVCPGIHRWRWCRMRLWLHGAPEERRTAFFLLDGSWGKSDDELSRAAVAVAAIYYVSNLAFHTHLPPTESLSALDQSVREMTRGHAKAIRSVARAWVA